MSQSSIIAKAKERFDQQFGIPNDTEDFTQGSAVRSAGCDDCFCNVKEREEHKDFLEQELTLAMDTVRKEMIGVLLKSFEDNKNETLWGDAESNEIMKISTNNFVNAVKKDLQALQSNE